MSLTYSTARATERMHAPSERWLKEQIRAGRFRARKLGRSWVMTEQDILDALEICSNDRSRNAGVVPLVGLNPRSRKRVASSRRRDGDDP